MTEDPDPAFDVVHPSGAILVRSCRGGLVHSVALADTVMDADARSLSEGILRTANVSYMKAILEVRAEIIAVQPDYPPDGPTSQDHDEAVIALNAHTLRIH